MPYADPDEQRRYQREWTARRRAEYLVGQTCAVCGARDGLELHHVDRTTKVSHRIWSWSRARIEDELAKCEWRCGDCHDEGHADERRAPCGTPSAYWRGCRCAPCTTAHADDARLRRALAAGGLVAIRPTRVAELPG